MDREELFTEFFNRKLKERGYTLAQLADASGISPKYLEQFAHGRFENLPSAPYIHGYFVRLGTILNFDAEEWWLRIKRDSSVKVSGKEDKLAKNRFTLRRYRAIAGAAAVLILIVLFFGLRYSKILGEPEIKLREPANALTRVSNDHITIEGRVENADELTVNGEVVELAEGGFRTEVPLQPGMNTLEIKAMKILGRETKLTRQIYYDASQTFIPGIQIQ